jgi:hypothetical protein
MVIFYILLTLPLTYFLLLIFLTYFQSKNPKLAKQLQNIDAQNPDPSRVESTTRSDISTFREGNAKPTYKKVNLTIQIPESPAVMRVPVYSMDPDNIFLKQFLQENCFPLFIWHKRDTGLSQVDKLTVMYMNLCAESYILLGLYQADLAVEKEEAVPMIYGILALAIAMPCASLFTLQLVVWGRHKIWQILKWSWLGLDWILLIGLPVVSWFVIEEGRQDKEVVFSWVFVLVAEIVFLEPFRALIKAGCHMYSRNNDSCYNFFNRL